jgi:ribosome biogenesis protein Nip4
MLEFKPLTEEDAGILRNLLSDFGAELSTVTEGRELIGSYGGRLEVFLTTKTTLQTLERCRKRPYTAGLYLGEIKKGDFLLGLEGAALLGPHTYKKVVVNKKAEQLVLYGRDVLHKSVLKHPPDIGFNERCLIVNEQDEVLGIGRVERDCIKNLADRGWYLRKGE